MDLSNISSTETHHASKAVYGLKCFPVSPYSKLELKTIGIHCTNEEDLKMEDSLHKLSCTKLKSDRYFLHGRLYIMLRSLCRCALSFKIFTTCEMFVSPSVLVRVDDSIIHNISGRAITKAYGNTHTYTLITDTNTCLVELRKKNYKFVIHI